MALMQCNIDYDTEKETTSVKWSDVPREIRKGDQVKFISNDPHTAIHFKDRSPFDSSARSQTIHVGMEAVLTFKNPVKEHFDCGTCGGTGTPYKGTVTTSPFVPWPGKGGDIP